MLQSLVIYTKIKTNTAHPQTMGGTLNGKSATTIMINAQWYIDFLIFQPTHMLWVLK